MITSRVDNPNDVTDFSYNRIIFDVSNGQTVSNEDRPVQDDMDFLGGIGRSFKILADYDIRDPFAPDAPLVINSGCFTGTQFMTGLRTYFSGYSPLKRTNSGNPMPVWSAMSGSFGRKLSYTGIGDLVLTGRAATPQILVIRQTDAGPSLSLMDAPDEMIGTRVRNRMVYLNNHFNDPGNKKYPAHFAVIGPAGEHWETVWYACIVGTTQEQLMIGEDKWRFGGRLGMGSVLGSKNVVGIVAVAEKDYYRKGDARLKAINNEIGRGDQTRGYRHPNNRDGLGGTGKNSQFLDGFGVLPVKNFAPPGENVAVASTRIVSAVRFRAIRISTMCRLKVKILIGVRREKTMAPTWDVTNLNRWSCLVPIWGFSILMPTWNWPAWTMTSGSIPFLSMSFFLF